MVYTKAQTRRPKCDSTHKSAQQLGQKTKDSTSACAYRHGCYERGCCNLPLKPHQQRSANHGGSKKRYKQCCQPTLKARLSPINVKWWHGRDWLSLRSETTLLPLVTLWTSLRHWDSSCDCSIEQQPWLHKKKKKKRQTVNVKKKKKDHCRSHIYVQRYINTLAMLAISENTGCTQK